MNQRHDFISIMNKRIFLLSHKARLNSFISWIILYKHLQVNRYIYIYRAFIFLPPQCDSCFVATGGLHQKTKYKFNLCCINIPCESSSVERPFNADTGGSWLDHAIDSMGDQEHFCLPSMATTHLVHFKDPFSLRMSIDVCLWTSEDDTQMVYNHLYGID